MKYPFLKIAVVAAAVLGATAGHAAGSILGHNYSLTTSTLYDDSTSLSGGPVSAVAQAGLTPRLDAPNAEAADSRTSFGIYWADGDSFDLIVFVDPAAFSATSIERATVDLKGLYFTDGAVPVNALSVSFNLADSDLEGYLASPNNPTGAPMPQIDVSLSPDSMGDWQVRVQLSGYSAQLVGDQAYMRFDIQTAAVPEPGTYALMALGLAGVAAWSRRRRG